MRTCLAMLCVLVAVGPLHAQTPRPIAPTEDPTEKMVTEEAEKAAEKPVEPQKPVVPKPPGEACKKDAECEAGSICSDEICQKLTPKRHVIPFYFSKKGDAGYRHIPPV